MISSADLSEKSLSRLHAVLAGHVERGDVPGAVALVSRQDEVHALTVGAKAVSGDEPMGRDTLFRISSMTKPIAAAATMLLVEESRFQLDDPVDALFPELADRKVLKRVSGPLEDTVPANRPITVRDLLKASASSLWMWRSISLGVSAMIMAGVQSIYCRVGWQVKEL